MDADINSRTIAFDQCLGISIRQLSALVGIKFVRQGDFPFPGYAKVSPVLRCFSRIPKLLLSVKRPSWRRRRCSDERILNPSLSRVIIRPPLPVANDALTGTIGGSGGGGTPVASADDLYLTMIARHWHRPFSRRSLRDGP